jgi:hypothetical protein
LTTITLRVSDSLASYLSSSQMRSWLDAFLRQPHLLPADPGPGDARVSLTLDQSAVDAVATRLRSSKSSALRQIAAEHLKAQSPLAAQAPRPILAGPRAPTNSTVGGRRAWPHPSTTREAQIRQDRPSPEKAMAAALIQFLLSILSVDIWLFFVSRKKKPGKAA